ncbi:hypothetical protein Mag101_07455 [Microbulbifer agarilyticus]|uniref:Uncharacterized protein n=1 Tax=Microbulbifer agarilyticus TaxID=260552 RepID=A0A1Q2M440_9GAMM|nr:hypothetical protein [Microbulbifer agarilyticus]AQQ67494.1 hypothetical protein Mag101_07455 [Microbulbifer agarilyticus]
MRINSETFDLYNQSAQRELRLVVVIEFPTPVYLASHGDISGLPAGALGGVLAKVSSTSQRLRPEAGRAEIGAINFELTDAGGVFTDTLRNQLSAGHGIKGRTVRLYQGGKGMDWADFRLEQTQVADESLSYDHGRYRVRCRDIQREMRKDIFVPRSTRLAADFAEGASTLQVYSTAEFEPNPHLASYGDAPNVGAGLYYLKIKYQNGYEIVRATGKTAGSFTGVTRGLFGTVEYSHTLPQDSDDDQGVEVEEYIYIELPAPALVYALLTGDVFGTGTPLPSNWHLGIDPAQVVLDDFTGIGADWLDTSDYSKGVILRFEGLGKTDGKQFIEREINLLMGAYMPVNAAGQLGYRRQTSVLADAGTVGSITAADVVSAGELRQDLAALRNIFSIQWAWYEAPGFDGRHLRSNVLADAASIAIHGEAKTQALKFRGLHNSRHTRTTLNNRFDALRDKFAGPPLRLRLSLLPSKNDYEVGDVVQVTLPQVRDYTRDPDSGSHRYEFLSDVDGWTPHNAARVWSNGVLAVTATGTDTRISRTLQTAEQFLGADLPAFTFRIRRTGNEPIPIYSNFFARGVDDTYYARSIDSGFIDQLNANPGQWFEYTVDYSGDANYAAATIKFLRLDIGHNHTSDYSYELDYIRALPDVNLNDQSLDRAMEVQQVSVDQVAGTVQVELFGSTQAASPIVDEAASTSAELPDAWYSADGAAMTAAGLTIDGSGFLTADGTLTGAASSRTIFYYLGDLTIPAGRTLTVTDNAELRVRGVLQIDGTLRGAPSNSGAGFVGSCRGGAGQVGGDNLHPQYIAVGARGEVVKGRNEILPALTLDNDGGALLGIPDDLRGSGGARGGNAYHYVRNDASYELAGFGGSGGAGGAGVAVVARGIALGVAGVIDTSGGDGLPGNDSGPQYNLPGGSGGGGAPGGVVLIIDGHQNPVPVLTNNKLVACYGTSPASPGMAGLGGKCLGTNAARVYTVPKSRSPYPNYTQDPALDPALQQAISDAQQAAQAAADAQSDASSALAKLDDIGADGKLHPAEKLRAVLEHGRLISEQAGIEASASAYAISTEKTNYTSAVSALTSYLEGLAPGWDDTSAVTSISRTLWNSNWSDAYDKRQALLNRIAAAARALGTPGTPVHVDDFRQAAVSWPTGTDINGAASWSFTPSDTGAGFLHVLAYDAEGARAGFNGVELGIMDRVARGAVDKAVLWYTFPVTIPSGQCSVEVWSPSADGGGVRAIVLTTGGAGDPTALLDAAQAIGAAADAQTDASAALDDLTEISADSKLHPAEKLQAVREYSDLVGERNLWLTRAAALGITSEATNYQNANSALDSYLAGLSPAWNSTSSTTAITRSSWNSNWSDVYATRQALVEAIAEQASENAQWAKIGGDGKPEDYATKNAADTTLTTWGAFGVPGGDMEDITPWGNTSGAETGQSSTYVFSGNYSLYIQNPDTASNQGWHGPSQTVPITPGKYKLRWTHRLNYSGCNVRIYVYIRDSSGANLRSVVDATGGTYQDAWQTREFVVDASDLPTASDIRIFLQFNRGVHTATRFCHFDNIRLLPFTVADTAELTDSAGLGQSASWSQVSGSGKPEDGATVGLASYEKAIVKNTVFFDDFSDPNWGDAYTVTSQYGTASFASYTGGSSTVGSGAARVYDGMHFVHSGRFAVEPGKLYRAEVRIYVYNHQDLDRKQYIGFAGIDANGDWVNAVGSNSLSSQHYNLLSGWNAAFASWRTITCYFKLGSGNGASFLSNGEASSTKANPSLLHQNCRYLTPYFLLNYIDKQGSTLIDYLKVEEVAIESQRDLPQIVGRTESGMAQSALSASDAGSTTTISVAAHTVTYGFGTVSYNSGSITGLNFSTTYYVYCDDPGYVGGAITYLASTDKLAPVAGTHRRYVGRVVTPANGGGSTGGGLPGEYCLVAGAWLRHGLNVDDLQVGQCIDAWDEGSPVLFSRAVQALVRVEDVDCVLLTTESGAQKPVSMETPVTLEDGRSVRAQHALGGRVAVQHDGQPLTWETITEVQDIGQQTVYRISVGGISYAGGVDPAHRIVTHNAYKP